MVVATGLEPVFRSFNGRLKPLEQASFFLSRQQTQVTCLRHSPLGRRFLRLPRRCEQCALPTEPCHHNLVANSTSMFYRLSHATVYINYDGYATYSMTFKSKAKVGLMTAAKVFCQKSRGYVKIVIGSQYVLAKISFEIID